MNTLEQDAFFAPSSTPYPVAAEAHFSQATHSNVSRSVGDFQSFTNNRPFQFIQTSYVMPDPVCKLIIEYLCRALFSKNETNLDFGKVTLMNI